MAADAALYQAKASGRNCVVAASSADVKPDIA
jgi:PleD family two-component response regulator